MEKHQDIEGEEGKRRWTLIRAAARDFNRPCTYVYGRCVLSSELFESRHHFFPV